MEEAQTSFDRDVIPDEVWKEVLEVAREHRISHGGETETSMLMAIAPHAVRTDYMILADTRPRLKPRIFRACIRMSIVQIDTPMMHGQQAKEKREKLVEATVKGCVSAIEDFITLLLSR